MRRNRMSKLAQTRAAARRRFVVGILPAAGLVLTMTAPAFANLNISGEPSTVVSTQPLLVDAADPMAGVSTEMLGSLPSAGAPGYTLMFLRITMQPGASIPPHSHPGDVVVVVQSGTFGTAFVRGQGTVTRAAAGGAPPATETLNAGDSAVLQPGDSLAYGGSAGHTMSDAGDTPLVLLVSALLADGQPGFAFDH